MEITNRKLLIIALIMGLIATGLVYVYLQKVEQVSQEVEPTNSVLVAKIDIKPKTVITQEMIEAKQLPTRVIPASSYTDQNELVGQTAKETIYAGETIVYERLADEIYQKKHLAYSIPTGYRALTLQYNPVMGVGGFVQPGDYVDVIGTYDAETNVKQTNISRIILQNMLVLAVGTKTDIQVNDENQEIQTITLAVKPQQAEKITFTEEKASVRLMLRPINEESKTSTTGTTKDNIFTP